MGVTPRVGTDDRANARPRCHAASRLQFRNSISIKCLRRFDPASSRVRRGADRVSRICKKLREKRARGRKAGAGGTARPSGWADTPGRGPNRRRRRGFRRAGVSGAVRARGSGAGWFERVRRAWSPRREAESGRVEARSRGDRTGSPWPSTSRASAATPKASRSDEWSPVVTTGASPRPDPRSRRHDGPWRGVEGRRREKAETRDPGRSSWRPVHPLTYFLATPPRLVPGTGTGGPRPLPPPRRNDPSGQP